MCIFSLFATLLIISVKSMTLVQETLQMKRSISHQFFQGTNIQDLPITFRQRADLIEYILDYQDMIEDKSNIFFRDNILLPWISVQTMRVQKVKCQELLERPGVGEYFFD